MAEIKIERTPFKEAIEFFKKKQEKRPSQSYTDLLNSEHDRAFVIAGVTDVGLLTDVHGLLTKSMQDGTTFEQFKKEFEKTIEGRWLPTSKTGEPNTGWRARVIYDTNIRTAYSAGQREQRLRVKELLPYWRYIHTGESKVPRQEHLKWHGLVLRWDDPWWNTHTPPNGWGCTCDVEACDDIDLREMGKDGPDDAPPIEMRTVRYGNRDIEVPKGIDPGWAYAPGADSEYQVQLKALAKCEPKIAARAREKIRIEAPKVIQKEITEFENWVDTYQIQPIDAGWIDAQLKTRRMSSEARCVEMLSLDVLEKLEKEYNIKPASAGVAIRGEELLHLRTRRKIKDRTAISVADIKNLPNIIANPQAVLYDIEKENLVYVFTPKDHKKTGKVIVEIDMSEKVMKKGIRVSEVLNLIISGGRVSLDMLKDVNVYKLLKGKL